MHLSSTPFPSDVNMTNPATHRLFELFAAAFPLYPSGDARQEALELLSQGADPTPVGVRQHVDEDGEPIYPLHAAISNLDEQMVEAMLDAGHPADLEIPDEMFESHGTSLATALQPLPAALQRWALASEDRDLEIGQQTVSIAKLLISRGASVFDQDTFGFESAWGMWVMGAVGETYGPEDILPWADAFCQMGEALLHSKELGEELRQERLRALRENEPIASLFEDESAYAELVGMPLSKAWAASFKEKRLEEQWVQPLPKKGPSPRF